MIGQHRSATKTGLTLAICSGIAFGTLSIFAKLAYAQGASALSLLAARFAFATVLLATFHVVVGREMRIEPAKAVRLLVLGGLGYGLEATLFFVALERAPAGVIGLIFYSYPVWTNLLGVATGLERFRLRVMVALVLGSAGVASIFTVSQSGTAGPLLALAAAVAVAAYLLLVQTVMGDIPAPAVALWTGAGAAVTTVTAALLAGWELPATTLPHAAALGFCSALAFVLLYSAIARIGSARSAIANMVEPVTTVVLAWMVLGEVIGLRTALGAALVVGALPVLATTEPDRMTAAEGPRVSD